MWWDERSVTLGDAASATTTSSAPAAAGGDDPNVDDGRLLATVDLEDPYLRDLVLDAFSKNKRRELWRVVRADGVREKEAPSSTTDDEGERRRGERGGSSSSDEEEEEEEDSGLLLAPHPLVSRSRFHWGEYERIDWDRVARGDAMASSYAVRKGLTRKAQLAFGLKKWTSKRPSSPLVGSFPETHVLQVDDVEYIDEALCDLPEIRDAPPGDRTRWIVKPSVTNRAAGVAVVDGVEGLRTALESIPEMREWVVQRYIDDPLLLPRRRRRTGETEEGEGGGARAGGRGAAAGGGGDVDGGRRLPRPARPPRPTGRPRKWHVRAYALCVGALSVYSFEGGMLALCARKGYEGAPLCDLDAHLTNTCRGRGGGDGEKGDDGENGGDGEEDDDDDRILLLSEIPELLSQQREGEGGGSPLELSVAAERTRALASRISSLIGETFAAVSSELTFFALPSAFELFGFDFLVDESWNPWLLEANADPDVGASGGRLRGVISEMVDGVLRLTADEVAAAPSERGDGRDEGTRGGDGGGGEGGPRALEWKLVFRSDAGRHGAGFRVG